MSTPQWRQAARVMRRAGFSARASEIDAAVSLGIERWVDQALETGRADPGVTATPPPTFEQLPPLPAGADKAQRQARNEQLAAQGATLTRWWIGRMLQADNPVLERVTLGWHDHWATSIGKVRDASAMLRQNQTLRTRGLGSFTDLAHAMIVDPALMDWLDAQKNTKAAPNENLAREFMELFCLGVDNGYTEHDVREGARALTGWQISASHQATFNQGRFDSGSKTVLGVTGNLDSSGFVDAVLAAQGHPGHVATRWWQHLAAADVPSPEVLSRLTAAYGTARDCRALLRAVLLDPAFADARSTIVSTPVEWLVGAMRTLKIPATDDTLKEAVQGLRLLGQVPFQPPNVAGWPRGQAWLSTASAQSRAAIAQRLTAKADLTTVTQVPAAQRLDAVLAMLGLDTVTNRTMEALKAVTSDARHLVAAALISPDYLVV